MAELESVTAVQWAWRADDRWILYEAAMNLTLENEYHKGTKRVKVDKERFVDLSLTVRRAAAAAEQQGSNTFSHLTLFPSPPRTHMYLYTAKSHH